MKQLLILLAFNFSINANADQLEIVPENEKQFVIKPSEKVHSLSLASSSQHKPVTIGNISFAPKLITDHERINNNQIKAASSTSSCQDVLHQHSSGMTLLKCLNTPPSKEFREFVSRAQMLEIRLASSNPESSLEHLIDILEVHDINETDITASAQHCSQCNPHAILISTPFK